MKLHYTETILFTTYWKLTVLKRRRDRRGKNLSAREAETARERGREGVKKTNCTVKGHHDLLSMVGIFSFHPPPAFLLLFLFREKSFFSFSFLSINLERKWMNTSKFSFMFFGVCVKERERMWGISVDNGLSLSLFLPHILFFVLSSYVEARQRRLFFLIWKPWSDGFRHPSSSLLPVSLFCHLRPNSFQVEANKEKRKKNHWRDFNSQGEKLSRKMEEEERTGEKRKG